MGKMRGVNRQNFATAALPGRTALQMGEKRPHEDELLIKKPRPRDLAAHIGQNSGMGPSSEPFVSP
jgi:hypothetical protein